MTDLTVPLTASVTFFGASWTVERSPPVVSWAVERRPPGAPRPEVRPLPTVEVHPGSLYR